MNPRIALGLTAIMLPLNAMQRQSTDPCPPGRTLIQQIDAADMIVFGKITFDRDCAPSRSQQGQRPYSDCFGRRADVLILQSWKGDLKYGDGLGLLMPSPKDSAGLLIRKGEKHVLFVKGHRVDSTFGWGHTDACMYPEGIKSDKELIKRLDAWKKTQPKEP